MSVDYKYLNLDRILVEELGQWGRFQFRTLVLMALLTVAIGANGLLYLFTVAKVETRCLIPECENNSAPIFSPPWLQAAVPTSGDSFDNCHRYPAMSISSNTSDSCPASLFDRTSLVECEEYVYEHTNSAYFEFNLACDNWRPTLVGSANSLGYMFCLMIAGVVADRWGRRLATAFLAFNVGWIGVSAQFAGSYTIYILLSFLQYLCGGCVYASVYILAVEYVGPKYRVLTGAIMSSSLSIGQILLGLMAWTEPYWRHLILMSCAPLMIFGIYYWIAPESVRWLMSKGRYEESMVILQKVAEMNRRALSERTLKELSEAKDVPTKEKGTSEPWLVCLVFKHKPILLRCLVTPIWWITFTLVYYGLTISSVGISGNKYLNYTASVAIEIPGFWIGVLFLDRIGRKASLITAFLISAACQFAFIFTSDGHYWVSLSLFLIGKMCISSVMMSLYVYTAELYPTKYRTRLFAYSSMIGRIGSVIAPLMPGLAAEVWEQLPFLVFGLMALVAGLLVPLMPETLGAALPDSMEEAAGLGHDSAVIKFLRTLVFRSKSYTIR